MRTLKQIKYGVADDSICLTGEPLELLQKAIFRPSIDLAFDCSPIWQVLLPDSRRVQKLLIDEPVLLIGGGDVHKDVQRVKKGVNIDAVLEDIFNDWIDESPPRTADESVIHSNLSFGLCQTLSSSGSTAQQEKLHISETALIKLHEIQQPRGIDMQTVQAIYADLGLHSHLRPDTPFQDLAMDDYGGHEEMRETNEHRSGQEFSKCSVAKDRAVNSKDIMRLIDGPVDDAETIASGGICWSRSSTPAQAPMKRSTQESEGFPACELERSLQASVSDDVASFESPDSRLTLSWQGDIQMQHGNADFQEDDMNSDMLPKSEAGDNQGSVTSQRSDRSLECSLIMLCHEVEGLAATLMAADNLKSMTAYKIAVPNSPEIALGEFEARKKDYISRLLDARHPMGIFDDESISAPRLSTISRKALMTLQSERIESPQGLDESIFSNQNAIAASHQLLWKAPGIRLLDDNEDETEGTDSLIELDGDENIVATSREQEVKPTPAPGVSLGPLILDQHGHVSESQRMLNINYHNPLSCKRRYGSTLADRLSTACRDWHFSASDSLSTFLDLRGRKFKAKAYTSTQKLMRPECDPIESSQQAHAEALSNAHNQYSTPISDTNAETARLEAVFSILAEEVLVWNRTIVIDNELMRSHPELVKSCEQFGDGLLTVIYRDFSTLDHVFPDLILDPRSCVVITNIQSFTQRGLPGQNKPGISCTHEKIIKLAHRFDLVIVLIACVKIETKNTTVLNEVSSFCASVSCNTSTEVKPLYIFHNSTEELQNATMAWVQALISKYAFPCSAVREHIAKLGSVSLIQDETVWELFLRRADMNVMAAQVVLSVMKDVQWQRGLFELESVGRSASGLGHFIQMRSEDRQSLFGNIIGSRCTARMNSMSDSKRRRSHSRR